MLTFDREKSWKEYPPQRVIPMKLHELILFQIRGIVEMFEVFLSVIKPHSVWSKWNNAEKLALILGHLKAADTIMHKTSHLSVQYGI